MIDTYPAFDVSPVPVPGPDARAPEPFHGIYGMPMFVSVPTADLAASTDFWVRGLGFFELFSVPGQVVHLRRWTFQDVLLVPTGRPAEAPALTVSFSCVLDQVAGIAAACEEARPGSTTGPRTMPWGSVELEVVTPENARVVMTAARPYDPDSPEAQNLRDMGIEGPGE
ncbi:VOC family protein [Promicromonospora kroppenstedtii]|uniref:VOC family protein n=1 Tax=Promicromonospora kroppenstedtii TaxID=440482 RepID=A0ABW7XIH5_9MICO